MKLIIFLLNWANDIWEEDGCGAGWGSCGEPRIPSFPRSLCWRWPRSQLGKARSSTCTPALLRAGERLCVCSTNLSWSVGTIPSGCGKAGHGSVSPQVMLCRAGCSSWERRCFCVLSLNPQMADLATKCTASRSYPGKSVCDKGISSLLEILVLISWTEMRISLLPSYSSHLQAKQPPLTCTSKLQPGNQIFFLSPLRLTFKVRFYLCISKGRLSQGQFKDLVIWVESLEVQCMKSILLEYEALENVLRAFRNTKIAASFCL